MFYFTFIEVEISAMMMLIYITQIRIVKTKMVAANGKRSAKIRKRQAKTTIRNEAHLTVSSMLRLVSLKTPRISTLVFSMSSSNLSSPLFQSSSKLASF